MRILWLTNVPSPYRVDFFNELGKQCELTVLFEKRTSDERDKSWQNYKFEKFDGIFLRGKSVNTDTAICPEVIRYIKKDSYDFVVVTNISSPTGILAIAYMRANRIPYWIEGDGGFAKKNSGIKHRLKTFEIKNAEGCFSTSKVHDEYYIAYGAAPAKIHRYPFTSISTADLLQAKSLSTTNKCGFRKELNMSERYIILSVGRFSYQNGYGKGYDVLMHLAEKMGDEYGFYLVGDEPTEEFIVWKEQKRLEHVHFVGFRQKKELAKYYAAADVFVLLSRGEAWGLVINEAMAYGLPIVTTDLCVAGTELVKDSVNGYIVSFEAEPEIIDRIRLCIDNQEEYGSESRRIIEHYTTEAMANKHVDILGGYK